ncbi:MAG: 8-amino-7-oxononanoate synthase [Myxococcota bacterium]
MASGSRPSVGPQSSLEAFALQKLQARERAALRRSLTVVDGPGPRIQMEGRSYISFSSNDYLGLAADQRLCAVQGAPGATASRLVVGHHPAHASLEAALAELKGTEACLLFGSGYHANLGVIPSLVGAEDLILLDERAHACLHAGATLSRAQVLLYRHDDAEHLETLLASVRSRHPRCLVGTEGVFSMDGDLARLPALVEACERHDAWLLVDDAHATGVLGAGSVAHWGLAPERVPLQMGTLSKAAGTYGGFVACSTVVRELFVNRARTFVYSTGLPPVVAEAGRKALEIMAAETWRRDRVLAYAARVAETLDQSPSGSAIVPWLLGDPERATKMQDELRERGYWVYAMRPPTVPTGTSRLRFSLSAAHREAEVDGLCRVLMELK